MDAGADPATSITSFVMQYVRGCSSFDIGAYIYKNTSGGMAQLARACVLHTQGYRFDPDYLQLHFLY